MWDLTLDWYSRVYSCVKRDDHYKCKRFYSDEAANMYRSYKRINDIPLIYLCRFIPVGLDSTILQFKLKEKVIVH